MSDVNPLEELIVELDATDDPKLRRLRDHTLAGEEQPRFELVESFVLLEEQISLEFLQPSTLEVRVSTAELAELTSDKNTSAFVVVRERSLTDNTIQLLIEVGSASTFVEDPTAAAVEGLAPISFFDHIDEEKGHTLGMIVATDAPLGHWAIDIGTQLREAAESAPEETAAVRLVVRPDEDREPKVPLTLGRISIDLIRQEEGG